MQEVSDTGFLQISRPAKTWFQIWLARLKQYFLLAHFAYISLCTLTGATAIYLVELGGHNQVAFLDALFVAVSCTTCTGLSTVDVTKFSEGSSWVRHLLMISGGTCFTSAIAPILRIVTLRRLRSDVVVQPSDTLRRARWKRRKAAYISRVMITSTIATVATYVTWFSMQFVAWIVLLATVGHDFNADYLLQRVVAAYHGCSFTGLIEHADRIPLLVVLAFCSSVGSPILPCTIRPVLLVSRLCVKLAGRLLRARSPSLTELTDVTDETHTHFVSAANSINGEPQETRPRALTALPLLDGREDADEAADGMLPKPPAHKILQGFDTIISSDTPVDFHAFLFIASETWYIFAAWVFLCLFQAFPYTFQQWDASGVLAPFPWYHKLIIAYAQSAGTRFAGLNFIDIRSLSSAHIMTMMFALYVPGLPIPTDRTRRKWKQLIGGSVWQLVTSRFWWLFVSMLVIVFVEEDRLRGRLEGSHLGIFTRVVFEVMSAYATSGLTLSIGNDPYSFSGACTPTSKVVLMLVMLAGRHRGMDLGIDLGLSSLEEKEREMAEIERLREAAAVAPVQPSDADDQAAIRHQTARLRRAATVVLQRNRSATIGNLRWNLGSTQIESDSTLKLSDSEVDDRTSPPR